MRNLEKMRAEHAKLLAIGGRKTQQQINRMDAVRKRIKRLNAMLQVKDWFAEQGVRT